MNGKDDPFYRYTMPRLQIKVEGSTKMIKTGVHSPANQSAKPLVKMPAP
jgi:hypothetical protein